MEKLKPKRKKAKVQFKSQNFKFYIILLPFTFCLLPFLSGCEQADTESINKITQEDPSFKPVLEEKQELDSKIALLLNQLRDLKTMTDANIRDIQENFNKQRKEIDSKVSALKRELEPERVKVREQMDKLRADISAKRGMLRSLEGTKRNLTNLINQQKAVITTDKDMGEWKEKLDDLNKQIEPLKGEIREWEERLAILRLKLIALRQ